jgi:hypothetical protein
MKMNDYKKLTDAYLLEHKRNIKENFDFSSSEILTRSSANLIKEMHEYIPQKIMEESSIVRSDNTDSLFANFHYYFVESYSFIQDSFDITKLKCLKIKSKDDIPIPDDEDFSYIHEHFQNLIYKTSKNKYVCTLKSPFGNGRIINIFFTFDDKQKKQKILDYIERILVWLYIISKYTDNRRCSKILNIYIYLTDPKKKLPEKVHDVIDKINVNTGFTTSCSRESNIVIYRKEEWFKVFIHETIHNFGLDFSEMDNSNTKAFILNIFPISSKVKLYETYTDFWARTVNCMFCSFYNLVENDDIMNKTRFIEDCYQFVNTERVFSYFQVEKILTFMKLDYKELYEDDFESQVKRFVLYKENTSVLAYYILCSVLFNKFNDFIEWCAKNNRNQQIPLQFNKTTTNQINFCKFIESNYKDPSFLRILSMMKKLNENMVADRKSDDELHVTLRKSILTLE